MYTCYQMSITRSDKIFVNNISKSWMHLNVLSSKVVQILFVLVYPKIVGFIV